MNEPIGWLEDNGWTNGCIEIEVALWGGIIFDPDASLLACNHKASQWQMQQIKYNLNMGQV